MNLHQLFKIQEILEKKIINSTDIQEDLLGKENIFDLKFLALQVKIGILANTTKCYKYYKNNKYSIPREKLIIRYIDAMKFLLSIGNEYNFNIINKELFDSIEKPDGLIKGFSEIFKDIIRLRESLALESYINALNIYIELFAKYVYIGEILDLTFEDVYNFYVDNYAEIEDSI